MLGLGGLDLRAWVFLSLGAWGLGVRAWACRVEGFWGFGCSTDTESSLRQMEPGRIGRAVSLAGAPSALGFRFREASLPEVVSRAYQAMRVFSLRVYRTWARALNPTSPELRLGRLRYAQQHL